MAFAEAATIIRQPYSPADQFGSWKASLELTLGKTDRGTRLLDKRHQGPLYVQKPFYPEGPDLAHIYLLHPPGGLVSGDTLQISVSTRAGAQALFTTPGAGRVYHSRPDLSLQTQKTHIVADENSTVEWFPLETIVFPGALGKQSTRIDLNEESRFISWEINCLGLPASAAPFTHGEFTQHYAIYLKDKPLFVERFPIKASHQHLLQGKAGLQGNTVFGLMTAGPCLDGELQKNLLQQLRQINTSAGTLLACTTINNILVIRYLGNCSEQARKLFTECWQILRPHIIKREACSPRIWHC